MRDKITALLIENVQATPEKEVNVINKSEEIKPLTKSKSPKHKRYFNINKFLIMLFY